MSNVRYLEKSTFIPITIKSNMMKKVIYVLAFALTTGLYAQEKKPIDKQEETTTKTTRVEKDGKVIEKKVKVTTRKEQEVKTKIDKDHPENSNRVATPVKVTQKVAVDNDNDPFYDGETAVQYYTSNENTYAFNPTNDGFIVSKNTPDSGMTYGKARVSKSKRFYVIDLGDQSGVGYFDANGKFVVEYYDDQLDALVIETFSSSKMQ